MERDDIERDPADEAVSEGGGGEAEGFELAEEELVENAEHGNGGADPESDAFPPEQESDAEYGEADDVKPEDA